MPVLCAGGPAPQKCGNKFGRAVRSRPQSPQEQPSGSEREAPDAPGQARPAPPSVFVLAPRSHPMQFTFWLCLPPSRLGGVAHRTAGLLQSPRAGELWACGRMRTKMNDDSRSRRARTGGRNRPVRRRPCSRGGSACRGVCSHAFEAVRPPRVFVSPLDRDGVSAPGTLVAFQQAVPRAAEEARGSPAPESDSSLAHGPCRGHAAPGSSLSRCKADWAINQAPIRCGIGRSEGTSSRSPSSSSAWCCSHSSMVRRVKRFPPG
jgi:hypothetical protein